MATGREKYSIGLRGFLLLAASSYLLIISSLCTYHPFRAPAIEAEIWLNTATQHNSSLFCHLLSPFLETGSCYVTLAA